MNEVFWYRLRDTGVVFIARALLLLESTTLDGMIHYRLTQLCRQQGHSAYRYVDFTLIDANVRKKNGQEKSESEMNECIAISVAKHE